MRLNEIRYSEGLPVDGYGTGYFRVGGAVHDAPLAVLPDGVCPWAGYGDTDTLVVAADALDVLFVGTGAEIAHIPPAFRNTLEQAGLGVEVMASPSACRTYNILLSEGRRVGLALLPV